MEIYFTEQSIAQLSKQLNSKLNYISLIYEFGGCGSPLDGTVRLKLTTTPPNDYVKISTNWIPIYIEHSTLMFLDDNLTVDFQSGGYLVKSNNQTYGFLFSVEKEY